MSDAADSAFLCEAENRFGDAGYATWFKILELIAKENGSNLTGKIEISERVLCQKLRKRSLRVEELLNFYQTSTSLLWKKVDHKFIIEVPKLLKLGDNYQKDLQGSGKLLASKEEEIRDKSKEVEVEEEKNTSRASRSRKPPADIPESIQTFRLVAKFFPNKILWPQVCKVLNGTKPEDLQPYLEEWIKRNYNPKNLNWLFDWFVKGRIPEFQELYSPNGKQRKIDPGRKMTEDKEQRMELMRRTLNDGKRH